MRPKIGNLIVIVRRHLEVGTYLDTRHASDRCNERKISRPELLFVLRNGYHEKRKDLYSEKFQEWNYAIRGKTLDGRNIRVIVSFDTSGMLIITAIDLDVG